MKNKKIKLFYPAVILFAMVFFSFGKVFAVTLPALTEGTYLTGQTLSVWPSWSLLGNALGVALPTDPINQLALAGTCADHTNMFCTADSQCQTPVTTTSEKCVLHDPETGWSVADRRFSFACSRDSYAYRYIVSTTPGVYTVRAKFEDTGISPANFSSFVASFVSTTIFKISDNSGICNYDQEISTMQSGVCGDGKLNLNKGEQCDPPGRIEYAAGCSAAVPPLKSLKVCNNSCLWGPPSTTLCSSLSRCGNGALEAGENCDDGALNGKYNHCNINCTGPVVNPPGRCGDAVLQPVYEICDPSTGPGYVAGTEKYSLTSKNDSCSWDCQNWGPYCGDKIVQAQHGEDCDGSQACVVAGGPGNRVCTDDCKKEDGEASAWWRMEKLIGDKSQDSSGNLNNAFCASGSCPAKTEGKYGNGFLMGEGKAFFTVNHSPSLVATTALTVSAWIFPTGNDSPYQKIVEKGGSEDSNGYDLEYNSSSTDRTARIARFNLWGSSQVAVDSRAAVPIDEWTYLVGTYEKIGAQNIVKIYLNGVLENENIISSAAPVMDPSNNNLFIGKGTAEGEGYFFGKIDEVKIYNRALSGDEISGVFQNGWLCIASTTPAISAVPGSCGDNVVDVSEACDQGAASNGQVCTPAYGAPCSYCSADCQNIIDVQPAQYCGDGVIQSPEKCEVSGVNIFSSASTTGRTSSKKSTIANGYQEFACAEEPALPHTIQKGAKSCADCAVGVVRNCVKCGVDPAGVSVDGSVINILQNPITGSSGTDLSPDPLFAKITDSGLLSLAIGNSCEDYFVIIGGLDVERNKCDMADPDLSGSPLVAGVTKNNLSPDLVSYTLLNPYGAGNALISSNPICSVDDNRNRKYQMYVNRDWARPLDFPVVAESQPWQYDLVLSPVVSSTLRSKDLRIVTSWVGSGDFYSGVLNPFIVDPQVEGPSYVLPCVAVPPATCLDIFTHQYAKGIKYYDMDAGYKKNGIWYHGFNSTPGQTNAESFTIDTAAMSGNTYSFYVRAPSYPIRTFKNTAKLKVDVYLPDNDKNVYHFGTPVKTYYFQAAAPSDNSNARYWQVFNINKPSSNLSVSDIIDVNAIITDPAHFQYITLAPSGASAPFTAVPIFSGAPAPSTPVPTPIFIVPDPPVLSKTFEGNRRVDLSWTIPANGGSPITSYEIWRKTSLLIKDTLTPNYTLGSGVTNFSDVTSLVNGTTYYYKIKAINANGPSSFSNEVSATPSAGFLPTVP